MKPERLKRYKEKLDFLQERINDLEEWTESFPEEKKEKLGVYKAGQELIETITDLAAMAVKDENHLPKDDESNINSLEKLKIINKELNKQLKEANGLRNILIHRYNTFDEKRAVSSLHDLLPAFKQFLDSIEKWLKKE